jgi:flagellar operon protein (TIGR03826 family)
MGELVNCSSCGKVFVMTTFDTCPTCRREIEEKFEMVWRFIRQKANRESTVLEVHEATGVEEKLIFQWIKEGRLQVKDFVNLTYPCKNCGEPIQGGTWCRACSTKLLKDVEELEAQEDKQNQLKPRTYFTR